jgi:RNA polymerase sigma factor (sigma-70 family)
VRRVIAARVRDRDDADDLVQETLARVIAHRARVDGPDGLRAYAIVTAQNLVANTSRDRERRRRRLHRLVDVRAHPGPEEPLLEAEDQEAIAAAITRLAPAEREVLLAHVLEGASTRDLAELETPPREPWPCTSPRSGPSSGSSTSSP